MLRVKSINSVLIGTSLTLFSVAAASQGHSTQPMPHQSQDLRLYESGESLVRAIDREKKLRELEQLRSMQSSDALIVESEPSPIRKTIPDTFMDSGLPQVLSLTGVGEQFVAEILHYGRIYRVDSSALQSSNGLWRAVRVTHKGVFLRPASGWKVDRLRKDRLGNVFVAAPQPGESFPFPAPYAPDPSSNRSSFATSGVSVPLSVISGGQPHAVTPAQSLATRLPPMR